MISRFMGESLPVAREGGPQLHPNLKLNDTVPFRLSATTYDEKRDGSYYVHDLRSTLGTIVNGQPIDEHLRNDDAPLRAGENEVIAGGVGSRFVFSVFIAREGQKPATASGSWGLSVQGPTYGPDSVEPR